MTWRRRMGAIAVAGLLATAVHSGSANAAVSYANCTAVNRTYPHGVGQTHARDHTSGTPVTSFRHSTKLYNRAMAHNRGLDRDHDGIACEKR